MELRLLGPVEAWHDGAPVTLGTPRQRCVLAVLTLTPGQSVPVPTLVDRVWGDDPPRNVRDVLYTHISRLRRLLEGGGHRHGGTALRHGGGGYVLDVAPGHVDLHQARGLVRAARSVAGDRGPGDERATLLLRRAASLWRGTPLAGVTGSWADRVRDALTAERLAVLTEHFQAELRLGRHAAAVGPLAELLAEAPLAESLAELLMRALYRCGRQAEALRVYTGTRERIRHELGAEPAAALRAVHEGILRRDPDLDYPSGSERAVQGSSSVSTGLAEDVPAPAQLPPDVAVFTGRGGYLRDLDRMLDEARRHRRPAVVAIEGAPGVGKTALAVHWAHRLRSRFADGQLYLDLRGRAATPLPPLAALGKLLRSLGVCEGRVPAEVDEATAMFRSLLADRRILLVLDDAADPHQVRPLLPGGDGCLVMVTGRADLSGLVALDGAHHLDVAPLTVDEATMLLTRLLGGWRVRAEPEVVSRLVRSSAHLPRRLRCAAADLSSSRRMGVAHDPDLN